MSATTDFVVQNGSQVSIDVDGNKKSLVKSVVFGTAATATTSDTLEVNLADHNMTSIQAVLGWNHTTTNSVLTSEQPTTIVSDGVLTITPLAGGQNTDRKIYQVLYT